VKRVTTAACLIALAACGRTDTPATAGDADAGATAAPASGTVIELRAVTDEKGNRYEPAKVQARAGDILRFTLVSGVHNVSFPVAANTGGAGLPPTGDMLQLPGQTYDLAVNLPAGTYHFQCDPHAALGMLGELEVE
jgi:plastocyanin